NLCRDADVKSQTMPGMFELLTGKVGVNRLRNVEISDLLRRNPANRNTTVDMVHGRIVLVTGAGGSIGSELARQVAKASPSRLVLLGHGENSIFETEASLKRSFPNVPLTAIIADIRDQHRMAAAFDAVRPQVVFHAAAHKHVPLMEDNPEEAVTNNVIGTHVVVTQCRRVGVERFVLISTDKAVAPTSIMGATKRLAEEIVADVARTSGQAFVTVRFGNVLGSRGSVVNTFKRQIEEGGPVTVTHPEMTRFFMTIPEAVHLVLEASARGKGGELFVLDMGEPIRIVDLARDLITLSGLSEEGIPITFVGMRPGEKMHEALFDDGLQARATEHPQVLEVIRGACPATFDIEAMIRELISAVHAGDRDALREVLARAIGHSARASSSSPGGV
ncbi:MAG: polysaccharide biosynthesis protein, partial [Pirellulales bacterium]